MKFHYLSIVLICSFIIGCTEQDLQGSLNKEEQTQEELGKITGDVVQKEQPKEIKEETQIPELNGEEPICENTCSLDSCNGFEYIACLPDSNGCKREVSQGKLRGYCGVVCLTTSDCNSDSECKDYKCVKKPEEERKETVKSTSTTTTSTNSDIRGALEKLQKDLQDYQERTNKLDECTKACAGEDYDIPAIRDEFYYYCYQIYYNLGLSELDEEIERCKNQ